MTAYDYDLFIVGGGSGGVRAARLAGRAGAKAAIAEQARLGGTCVNVGCVPKKLLVYASMYRDDFDDAAGYGWTVGERRFDWPTLIARKDAEIRRLNDVYRRLVDEAGVMLFEGRAALADPHTVTVGGHRVTARHILIATGGRPHVPAFPGSDLAAVSDDVFSLDRLPPRVLIVGGGYIAVEFAGIFHGLGAKVTQLYRRELFLRGFDDELRRLLAEQMVGDGIDLRFSMNIASIERSGGSYSARLTDGSTVEADIVLMATGRVPNTSGIGLEAAGVTLRENGAIVVDEYSRSTVPHIHAVGDCTDRLALTPVALAEATAFVNTVFLDRPTAMRYDNIPSCVFSRPNLACVGLTEADARRQGLRVDVYRATFRPMKHTMTDRSEKMMMKLVVDADSDRVMGCHMLGHEAGEIIQGLAVAMTCGATKRQFDQTLGIHPTAAEEFVTMRTKA